MKILICSHAFEPSVGGIETVGAILAQQFCRLGSTVTVVTNTPGDEIVADYTIVRQPSLKKLRALGFISDVILQNNISLHTLLPLIIGRKPIVIGHHVSLTRLDGTRGWQDYLKLSVLPFCRHIAVSSAIAADLPVKSVVIGNPFEAAEFTELQGIPRIRDIVFMGRLVSQKGCDLLIKSLSILKRQGSYPSVSIIGDGPEMARLKGMTLEFGLGNQVRFMGTIREGRGQEVARHRIMAIPSVYAEPFGIVALEGIAAGCVIVASSAGGLPDAVGPCGVLFPQGDAVALATALNELLASRTLRERLTINRASHLARFQPETVAKQYLNVLHSALANR